MRITRRKLLQGFIGAASGLAALSVPAWYKYVQHTAAQGRAPVPPITTSVPAANSPAPSPLGPAKGADGRPVVYDLDSGRISQVTQTTAVMVSGMGPRLLRFKPGTVFTFEGNDQPLSAGVLKDGDLLDASGTTLQDYSLDVDHVVVNPIWNQSGILGWVDATGGIAIFLRAGKEVSAYGPDPTTFVTDGRLQIFGGRGYSGPPNRTLGELQPGSWILCNGYRTRDGVSHALQCYVGNELPPPDAPEPLLQSIREHSQHGG